MGKRKEQGRKKKKAAWFRAPRCAFCEGLKGRLAHTARISVGGPAAEWVQAGPRGPPRPPAFGATGRALLKSCFLPITLLEEKRTGAREEMAAAFSQLTARKMELSNPLGQPGTLRLPQRAASSRGLGMQGRSADMNMHGPDPGSKHPVGEHSPVCRRLAI